MKRAVSNLWRVGFQVALVVPMYKLRQNINSWGVDEYVGLSTPAARLVRIPSDLSARVHPRVSLASALNTVDEKRSVCFKPDRLASQKVELVRLALRESHELLKVAKRDGGGKKTIHGFVCWGLESFRCVLYSCIQDVAIGGLLLLFFCKPAGYIICGINSAFETAGCPW